jgi:ACS family hexuronate transporter-like MFS transporter
MNDPRMNIKAGHYRYRILALVFMATTINYFDRSILGVLAPTLQNLFGWTNKDYAAITVSFKIAYGIGLLFMGGFIDRYGTKIGYTLSIITWSIFGMLHAAIRQSFSLIGFMAARFGLGIGESGNFPAAIKTVAEWFPKKDRAFATGIFDASTSVGAILAPFIVGAIVTVEGKNWQVPFLMTGALSALWVFLWLKTYRKPELHPKVSEQELEYINSDSEEESTERIPWMKILPKRETWAFALTTITDAVWWFYLFWGAKFLGEQFGVDIKNIGLPFLVIFIMADAGSLIGGYASGALIKNGWSINSYTLVPDVFPEKATASVIGIGKMVGVGVSIIADLALGSVLYKAGNSGYLWAFIIAGLLYLVILFFVHLLMPMMTPMDDNLNYIKK